MRIVIARVNHETNTFSPVRTPLGAFNPKWDADALAAAEGSATAMGAFIDFARARDAEIVTPVFALANPSGPVEDDAYEALHQPIVDAVRKGCDAILLDLHGAMATRTFDDGEGELLRRLRAIVPGVPIGVALDLHGNITEAMIGAADVIVGFKTYPHVDMRETGAHVAQLMGDILDGGERPALAWRHPPILAQTLKMNTTQSGVMSDLVKAARRSESEPGVQAVTIFGGFPIADIAEAGVSVVVVADTDNLARRVADRFADMAWRRREEFTYREETLATSITTAKRSAEGPGHGPVLLLDHGDNCMSGGTCDVMDVIEEAQKQGLSGVLAGPIADPDAVAAMAMVGVGAEITVSVGNRHDLSAIGAANMPLSLTGTVTHVGDGDYVISGPTYTGMRCSMGRVAVLETEWASILVSELPQEPWDKGVFACAGLDPAASRYLILKSRMYCRPVFEPMARTVIECGSAGVTSSKLGLFAFKHLARPIYPLDREAAFGESMAQNEC
ncbi:M81 family metallopeptidase [Nitratireductor soli]|uniref:M81 family metallopeptidase n=1 Tax=Nitratireductor soli TaxID=1670619 RepID=UPI00065E35E6|nr:M81 family metallopeptidase [Nitratireductor soli]